MLRDPLWIRSDDEGSGPCADELRSDFLLAGALRLLRGALAGVDLSKVDECILAESPVAFWIITLVYVTLTSVLLVNLLIAMCARGHRELLDQMPHSETHPLPRPYLAASP